LAVDRDDDTRGVRLKPDLHIAIQPDPRADLERLKTERDAADRAYNEALTRLDRAIQRLPADFPHPPPGPDEHQVTPLNTLWKIDIAPPAGGLKNRLIAAVRQIVAPLFEQQQAFNSAVVDHINRNVPVDRQTRPRRRRPAAGVVGRHQCGCRRGLEEIGSDDRPRSAARRARGRPRIGARRGARTPERDRERTAEPSRKCKAAHPACLPTRPARRSGEPCSASRLPPSLSGSPSPS
jgi:hypothetical protein